MCPWNNPTHNTWEEVAAWEGFDNLTYPTDVPRPWRRWRPRPSMLAKDRASLWWLDPTTVGQMVSPQQEAPAIQQQLSCHQKQLLFPLPPICIPFIYSPPLLFPLPCSNFIFPSSPFHFPSFPIISKTKPKTIKDLRKTIGYFLSISILIFPFTFLGQNPFGQLFLCTLHPFSLKRVKSSVNYLPPPPATVMSLFHPQYRQQFRPTPGFPFFLSFQFACWDKVLGSLSPHLVPLEFRLTSS